MAILRDSLIARVQYAGARDDGAWRAPAAGAANPDRAQLAALYAEHSPAIHRFLSRLLGDAAAAADATQETFVRAFRRFDGLCDSTRTVPWLFGIARNVSLEMYKARRRAQRVMVFGHETDEIANTAGGLRSPECELLDREALDVVQNALARLSEDRRAALLLRLDHGLAYDQIAELMEWTLSKTKVEVFRAREVLRATLAEYEEGGAR